MHPITAPKHIALVKLSALGDALMILPLIHTLRHALPESRLTWIISDMLYPLFSGLACVDFQVIKKPRAPQDYWRLQQHFKHHHYDTLLALQCTSFRTNLLYPFIAADQKIGFDTQRACDIHHWVTHQHIPSASPQHYVDSYLSFAEQLHIHDKIIQWNLPITNKAQAWAHKILAKTEKPILAINPSASIKMRNWPVPRYIDVIQQAQHHWQVHVVLTGGNQPKEKQLGQTITQAVQRDITDLIGQTTLPQLAALYAHADVALAPDTGPTHLAVAVGTPVVGLYAVAPPELSGPYTSQHLVVNRYPEAVERYLKKPLGKLPWPTRVHHPEATALITVRDVMEKLEEAFRAMGKPKTLPR